MDNVVILGIDLGNPTLITRHDAQETEDFLELKQAHRIDDVAVFDAAQMRGWLAAQELNPADVCVFYELPHGTQNPHMLLYQGQILSVLGEVGITNVHSCGINQARRHFELSNSRSTTRHEQKMEAVRLFAPDLPEGFATELEGINEWDILNPNAKDISRAHKFITDITDAYMIASFGRAVWTALTQNQPKLICADHRRSFAPKLVRHYPAIAENYDIGSIKQAKAAAKAKRRKR